MTIREYISQKLPFFKLTDAQFVDISESVGGDVSAEYTAEQADVVGKAMVAIIEEQLLTPRMSNISENGFSMSWNYADLGKFYMWLCRKYGLTPKSELLDLLELNTIQDKSHSW